MIKKISKNTILITIGIILGLTIGVYAATQIASSNVTYTNNGQENVQGAIDDLFNKTKLQVGSYVYMTPSTSSYTIPAADTGYTEDQTIKPSELNRWIIISKNSDGTYDAVSQYVSNEKIYFSGQIGYLKLIGTLNTIANQYQNGTYTTKARHIGYIDQTETITDTSALTSTTAPWEYSTYSYPDTENEPKGFGDVGYMYDYQLVKNVVGSTQAYKANATTTATAYWMASRYYYYYSSTGWNFRARYVYYDGSLDNYYLYNYYGSSFFSGSDNEAIRPIVTLKSGIKVTGGLGTSADPYTIGV